MVDALTGANASAATKEAFRRKLRNGEMDDKEIDEVQQSGGGMPMFEIPGMPGAQMARSRSATFSARWEAVGTKTRRLTVKDVHGRTGQRGLRQALDQDQLVQEALKVVEQNGIVFLDELDKIAARRGPQRRRRVARGRAARPAAADRGTTVATKHGPVKTDHILFIASGAFHVCSRRTCCPSCRAGLPIRVELKPLTRDDFRRILTEPERLPHQADGRVDGDGGRDARVHARCDRCDRRHRGRGESNVENIGARRLQTVIERVLDQISFAAPDRSAKPCGSMNPTCGSTFGDLAKNADLSRFIL